MAQSIQSKIMQFGEQEFWSAWFHRYAKYGPELGEKMANIVGVKGITSQMIDMKDFNTDFPPGVLAADPRYLQNVYNLSDGTIRGPWNEGEIKGMGKEFIYIEKPLAQVLETQGQTKLPESFGKELKAAEKLNKEMSEVKSSEVNNAQPEGVAQWSTYNEK